MLFLLRSQPSCILSCEGNVGYVYEQVIFRLAQFVDGYKVLGSFDNRLSQAINIRSIPLNCWVYHLLSTTEVRFLEET